MSANLLVDLGATCQSHISIFSGTIFAASGGVIGQPGHLGNADTFCNLFAMGTPVFTSGQLRLQVQTSDSDVSGNYTDPTSGLATFPSFFKSGGILWLNSGQLGTGVLGAGVSGQNIQSGFAVGAGFVRNGTFARVNVISGDFFAGTLTAGFISQLRTTGSGGGFTLAPSSGVVAV